MRLRIPCSRRKTTLYASALKVVASTAIPAIPGTITSRSLCLVSTAHSSTRNSNGSRKLKNAALGLRQNILRSSRNWRQDNSAMPCDSAIGGQLQVDVLERRAGDAEPFEPLAALERSRRQLVQ